MEKKKIMRVVSLLSMVPLALAFALPITGRWKPVNHSNIAVVVADHEVFGTMQDGGATVRVRADHDPASALVRLTDIDVVRRPSDWYNAAKYSPFVGIYRQLKAGGAECGVGLVDDRTVVVDVLLAGKHYCFHLTNATFSES